MQLTLPILILADLGLLLKVVYAVLVLVTIGVIIHDKREPVKALAWITVIALIPVAGMVLYVVFGRNHRKEKIFNRKEIRDLEQIEKLCAQQLKAAYDADPADGWAKYHALCASGGSKLYAETLAEAGLPLPYAPGAVEALARTLQHQLTP